MTKEEILEAKVKDYVEQNLDDFEGGFDRETFLKSSSRRTALEAMEIYAASESREKAIGFRKFSIGDLSRIYLYNGNGTWTVVVPSKKITKHEIITDDQLYDLYIESLKK